MIKEQIHKWFYPFNKTLNVTLVCEYQNYCYEFKDMLCQVFAENKLQVLGGKCDYDKENDLFWLLLDETFIYFKLTNKTVSLHKNGNEEDSLDNCNIKDLNGDIVIFITSFDKYGENDFYSVITETDRFMCNNSHLSNVILTYFGVETLTEVINDDIEWHNFINSAYGQLIQKPNNSTTLFDGLMNTVRHYSAESPFYSGKLGCNFFYSDAETQRIRFGQSEFICNFVTHLLHFDKMNDYRYLIKN